jgi:formate dehydrogenase subunit gamma
MISGEVDEGWARQHHNVWLEEVQQGSAKPAGESGSRSAAAPT